MGYEFTQTSAFLQRCALLAMFEVLQVVVRRPILQRPTNSERTKSPVQSVSCRVRHANTRPRITSEETPRISAWAKDCRSREVSTTLARSLSEKAEGQENCCQKNTESCDSIWDFIKTRLLQSLWRHSASSRPSFGLLQAVRSRMVMSALPCGGASEKIVPWVWVVEFKRIEEVKP